MQKQQETVCNCARKKQAEFDLLVVVLIAFLLNFAIKTANFTPRGGDFELEVMSVGFVAENVG